MAEKSFLAQVKDDITSAFAEQYDTLSDVCTDEDKLAESLKTTQRKVWDIVEKNLKQSYLNGKKQNGKPEAKPNPFRKS